MKKLLITFLAYLLSTPIFSQNNFYVGTYTSTKSEGIYKMHIDVKNNKLILDGVAAKSDQPSYLAFSKDHQYVVAVNENSDNKLPGKDGQVSLFKVDKASGNLTFVNQVNSGGAHPCHVSLDDQNNVFVANYSGGNVGVFKIKDGVLEEKSSLVQYEGKGPRTNRQEAAHAHFSNYVAQKERVYTVDLGSDKVHEYKVVNGALEETNSIAITPGGGPRHLVWSKGGKFLYVLNELSCSVSAYAMSESGYELKEEISTLPSDFDKSKLNTCAAIKVSKDGKFLYASNRGHNSIVVYRIDQKTGKLKNLGFVPTHGDSPRDFSISPKQDFVVVSNQQSNNVVLLKRNKKTGMLEYKDEVEVPLPVNVVFW
ncbi:lactonase family protein [Flammeovirga sp. EKP202]|uniref:lactonase family protein n=1 Tax=Flammeovirga sp. EKP202 TaxID=2770592 RepID=UPI00165F5475|nr:lactonase family protein [Flammeovirga sp. EKP202]MBD0400361.1 lactonase family protein [Flammeovirga sp. EKP202]